jgi:phosphatidate cytidylyltransferase
LTNFIKRTLSGAIFVAVLISAIWFGPLTCAIVFLTVVGICFYEFNNIAKRYNTKPAFFVNIVLSLFCFILIISNDMNYTKLPIASFLMASIFMLFIFELYRNNDKPFLNIAMAILPWFYLLMPFVLLWKIAYINGSYNPWHILGIMILQWTSDTCQYIFGITMGRHKLFERISPKKSIEGFIGGGLSCIGIAFIISKYNTHFSPVQWVTCAAIIVVFGTLGDLIESMLKRSVNIKDSGNIMPGHGGLLDRFDGVFGAMPFLYLYLSL